MDESLFYDMDRPQRDCPFGGHTTENWGPENVKMCTNSCRLYDENTNLCVFHRISDDLKTIREKITEQAKS